jgi:O-antigen/teichoic acid export membrane protein
MTTGDSTQSAVAIDRRLVYVNSASSAAARLLNVFVLVWMYQYLLERISSEEFAIYPVIVSVMAFAPLFSSLFTGGVSRYVVDAYARRETEQVTRLISSLFPLLAVFGVVLLGLGLVFSWHIDHVLAIAPGQLWDARIMMVLLISSFLLTFILLPFGVGFHVKQKFVYLNLIEVARTVLRIVVLFVLLFGVSTRVLWVVVATVCAEVAATLLKTLVSRRLVPELRFRPRLFDFKTAKKLVGFGFWTSIGQLVAMIHTSAAVIILNLFGTSIDVTAYYIGSMIDRQIRTMTSMAVSPVQPAVTAMHATGDLKRMGRAYLRGGRYALWVTLLAACPLSVYSQEFVQLYIGNTYAETAIVIILLMGTFPFIFSTFMLGPVAIATARVRVFFLGAFITQVICVGLMVALVHWMEAGAVGVALAIFIVHVMANVVFFWPLGLTLAGEKLGRFLRQTIVPGLMPSLVGLVVWGGLKLHDAPDTWMELGAYTLIGALFYVAALYVYCMEPHEKDDVAWGIRKVAGLCRL